KKHNLKLDYVAPGGYRQSITSTFDNMRLKFLHLLTWNIPNTKTVLLFPGGDIPPIVFNVLKNIIGPIKFEYNEYIPTKTDYIICRENQINDFATLVKLATGERLKVKPETFDLTPTKLAKLSEIIGFEEVCDKDGKFCPPKEAKRNNDFKVAQPLFVIAANSGLLDTDPEGLVYPGKNATKLLSVPPHKLAKQLFKDYLKKNNICEIHYTTYIAIRYGYWRFKWTECRQPIINLLKNCPIEKFIKFENFDNHAQRFYGNFFRRLFYGDIAVRGYKFADYYDRNYEPDWSECESQIIRVILSFLSAIGIVDIAYTENVARIKYANDDYCIGIAGFRITKLGAWILGITDKYQPPTKTVNTLNDQGQLIVLPDYSIIISGLKCRIEHETYFSKFLTKISIDGNAAVYKLDFQSIIRAHDNNITPQKIKKDLQNASNKPLPDNVTRSLDDWQLKIGRVKIHTLTVLETDDPLLLEEIKHIKGLSGIIIRDLPNAIAIDGEQQKKAKTLIEKNGWPVKL
ncbi:MAG: helicase-associated domain-containing protein, partial [Nitrososphaerota archaeon]|nr:helicase-associated domain-containing protein [Nitrososphaerota archaeon]